MSDNYLVTERNADLVFCIDGTGSMAPYIDSVKKKATEFHQEFVKAMMAIGKEITSLRVKVIVFRDYEADGENAMQISRFFELPNDGEDYANFLANVKAEGGGDAPENGLEALYFAMKSDFTTGVNDRQVIVLFTDTDALELGKRSGSSSYPSDMVDEQGLRDMWACVTQDLKLRERNKRLIIFAPEETEYSKLKPKLGGSIFHPVKEDGLKDISFDEIMKLIAASM